MDESTNTAVKSNFWNDNKVLFTVAGQQVTTQAAVSLGLGLVLGKLAFSRK